MSNDLKVLGNLSIDGYKNVAVKSVNILEREGKKPLVFIDLADADTFKSTGEMMYLKKDLTINEMTYLKNLEAKHVKAVLQLGTYNNRPSVNIIDIQLI